MQNVFEKLVLGDKEKKEAKKDFNEHYFVVTIEDISILGIKVVSAGFISASSLSDLKTVCKMRGWDAVIGLRIEKTPTSEIYYGTAIRYRIADSKTVAAVVSTGLGQ